MAAAMDLATAGVPVPYMDSLDPRTRAFAQSLLNTTLYVQASGTQASPEYVGLTLTGLTEGEMLVVGSGGVIETQAIPSVTALKAAHAYLLAANAQTINSSVLNVALIFDTAAFDSDSWFSPGVLTVSEDGLYLLTATLAVNGSAGNGTVETGIEVNGAPLTGNIGRGIVETASGDDVEFCVTAIAVLSANDDVTLEVSNATDQNMDFYGSLAVVKLGTLA